MRQVVPYRSLTEAKRVLDNGGRFYNLLTKAEDESIDVGELARAARVFSAGANAFLYLELALARLSLDDQLQVRALLSDELAARAHRYRPQRLAPSQVAARGEAGRTAILEGYPRFAEEGSITTVVMVPMQVGQTTVMQPMPMTDHFDVYTLHDDVESSKGGALIANVRGNDRLALGTKLRIGGVLEQQQDDGRDAGLYLETQLYSVL